MNFYENRIGIILESLNQYRFQEKCEVTGILKKNGNYIFGEIFQKEETGWQPFGMDETWGGSDRHYWFYTLVHIPQSWAGKTVCLSLHTGATDIWNTDNPQVLLYVNGMMTATMDMNHNRIILTEKAEGGDLYELAFYAYSNSSKDNNFFQITLEQMCPNVERLYYDIKVPYEAAVLLREDDLGRVETLEVLNACVNQLDLRIPQSEAFLNSVESAIQYLQEHYYQELSHSRVGSLPVTVHSIGHTHIDVAWKWTLSQTRQKAVRSFLTVSRLMKQYPEYKFMSSQPQLYQYVKESAPKLYGEIKELVKQGRWETEGAMWLEADCNLSSGESLIRQILYGKQFFCQEFGTEENEILWLPDVFGYSVALPQILKKSGIRYFMTTKLGWNENNQIPHDTMMWQGLDGSEILTYFITTTNYQTYPELNHKKTFNTTYNGLQNAKQIMGTWQRFQDQSLSRDVLTCYGYGDGGGGPTAQMLEENRRLEQGICGCPVTKQTFTRDFFHILEHNLTGKKIPRWCGELYLEFHRGTYTSMARNKKNNRECEFLNGDAEFFSVLAGYDGGTLSYPKKQLEEVWKLLMLNQFHDILPGSSIKEVYQDSDLQYARIRQIDHTIIREAQKNIVKQHGYQSATGIESNCKLAVFNTVGFERTGLVKVNEQVSIPGMLSQKNGDGTTIFLAEHVSSKGFTIYETKKSVEQKGVFQRWNSDEKQVYELETLHYKVRFNQSGEFASLYDRDVQREVLREGEAGNRFTVYEDRPKEYDAWNIDPYYEEKSWILEDIQNMQIVENGPVRGGIRIKRRFQNSVIEQTIYFYHHSKRIDFETVVDWKEQQLLLKVAFPVEICSDKAVYEVQFGNVERPTHKNTSWDEAKFEVCAHKWADLSECGYGVALLNNCKYGYDIHDSVMRLTLIKSGIFPNPDADKELHQFTYSCYPHLGDFREGNVIQEAYDLNCPLTAMPVTGHGNTHYSLIESDTNHVYIDTVKRAEDGNDLIIRMYEAYGKRGSFRLHIPAIMDKSAYECDCMEREQGLIAVKDDWLLCTIKPYEIKTIRIKINELEG